MSEKQKGLSPEQRRYALKRVDEILKNQLAKLVVKHTKKGEDITPAAKLFALRDELHHTDFPLRRGVTLDTSLAEAFDFSFMEPEDVLDRKAYDKESTGIYSKCERIKDMIMLGDGSEALSLLATLENIYG